MLKRFTVSNFKQFQNLSIDFTDVKEYGFSKDCLTNHRKNKLIKTIIVYGKNASGKSNFGFALFDIVQHLVDKYTEASAYNYYLNADNPTEPAFFSYTFELNRKEIVYEYSKLSRNQLVQERLSINGVEVFSWDSRTKEENFSNLKKFGFQRLNWVYKEDNALSFLRYIANNSVLSDSSPIRLLMNFVASMVWFRRADSGNNFIGFHANTSFIHQFIIKENLIAEYQKFLNENQVNGTIVKATSPDGTEDLYFAHKHLLPVFQVASSGTFALTVLFYWLQFFNKASFVFMDEFDAFYHFDLAEKVFGLMKKCKIQSILTTHNTNLLKNSITRPDCCFCMDNGNISSFANLSIREIREGNNLEKLYIGGAFNYGKDSRNN